MFFQQTKPPKGLFSNATSGSHVAPLTWDLATSVADVITLYRYFISYHVFYTLYIKYPLKGPFWDNTYSFPGPFWDALSDTSFQSAAFHSPAVDDSDVSNLKSSKIIFKCLIFVFQSEDENDVFIPASM